MSEKGINELLEGATEFDGSVYETINRLAALPRIAYEQVRKEQAKHLGISRVRELDRAVDAPQSTAGTSGVTAQKKPPTWGGPAASRCGTRSFDRPLKNTLKATDPQYRIDIRASWPILPRHDGSFEWTELVDDGPAAHAVAVANHRGSLIDCVAWYPDAPGRWWTLRRVAVVLGEDAVERADWFDDPITLYETPADWLKASACGDLQAVCILDWSFDPRLIFKPGMVVKPSTPKSPR